MSARALQRVAVRMLHDPDFADAVHARPDEVLSSVDLTPAERGFLAGSDRRAWHADPERPSRVFEAIRKEFPASCALAEVASGGREELLRFFSSLLFHDAVQSRAALAPAFGEWLVGQAREGHLGRKPVAAVGAIEQACSGLRRLPPAATQSPAESLPERLRASPRQVLLRLPAGSLDLLQETRQRLESGLPVPRARLDSREEEWVLIEQGQEGRDLSLGYIPSGLARLLEAAASPVDSAQLSEVALAAGADEDEVGAILLGLVEDGLLVPVD